MKDTMYKHIVTPVWSNDREEEISERTQGKTEREEDRQSDNQMMEETLERRLDGDCTTNKHSSAT